jgi:group I intron endonuclease
MGRNNTFTIYAHINPLTHKAYVGQTSFHPYLRWKNGSGYFGKSFKDLRKDFKEIGWDNFKHPILEDNLLTKEKADELEKYYIKKYLNERGVYNQDEGGSRGGKGYKLTKESKKTPVYQIDKNLNIIAEFNSMMEATSKMLYDLEDAGKDISNITSFTLIAAHLKGHYHDAFGYYWCKKSDYKPDWKPTVGQSRKKVLQYDLKGNFIREWDSISDAARALNPDIPSVSAVSAISAVCKGKVKTAAGFIWKYPGDNDFSKNFEVKKGKKVFQYDLNCNLIKEWESVAQAGRELNIHSSSISNVCTGKTRTAMGFIWKYEGDNDFTKNFEKNKNRKKVIQYDLKGNFIKEWDSVREASKSVCINESNISNVCTGKYKQAGGFIWKYSNDNDFTKNFEPNKTCSKKVFQYDLNDKFIKEWDSVAIASRELSIYVETIYNVCNGRGKTAGGFIWKYAEEQK